MGIFMLLSLGLGFGLFPRRQHRRAAWLPVSLLFIGVTTVAGL
ncbi:MAG: hypothetical protein R2851_16085 [Caldilineaceae bacterium]